MRAGLGIVTFERFDRFKECFENLLKNRGDLDRIVIVDDASIKDRKKYDEYFKNILVNDIDVVVSEKNMGVAHSKNTVLKHLYDLGCEYMFTLEDDINVVNSEVFNKYIELAEKSGFHYFNFGLHGPANVGKGKKYEVDNVEFMIYPESVGAFSLHTKQLIDEIGFYDENYVNAWEHVDYAYVASMVGLTTPFWSFIDLVDSDKYLQEQKGSIEDSSIRPRTDWKDNIHKGLRYWEKKHKVYLFDIPR